MTQLSQRLPEINNHNIYHFYQQAKTERQKVELKLLKNQEKKTQSKINEIKNKTQSVYQQKLRVEKKKEIKNLNRNKDQLQNQEKLRVIKTAAKQQRESVFKKYEDEKEKLTISLKEQKNNLKKKRISTHQNNMEQLLIRAQIIRQQQDVTKMKVLEHRQIKKLQNQCTYMQQTCQQEAIKNKKELEIQQLEQQEMELINKLQISQAQQKQAYGELKQALLLPAQEFKKTLDQQKINSIQTSLSLEQTLYDIKQQEQKLNENENDQISQKDQIDDQVIEPQLNS